MGKKDPRIDAYIGKAAPFAQPILTQIRSVVHQACPDVEETLKWGHPTFMHHGILCGMAAFKEHATLGFWKGQLILDQSGTRVDEAMGQFGRLTALSDLPAKSVLARYVREAMRLNEQGIKVPKREQRTPKPPLRTPADLAAALKQNRRAHATYQAFSPSNKREYVEWLTEAKGEATRRRRLETAIAWMAEGKPRNWKYMKRS